MPILNIQLLDGRSDEMKKELIQKVSVVTADTLKIPLEHVQVILHEVSRKHWARGGVTYSEKQ
ncbi:MAG: 2-hydroxymuconate tautomerase family protein [Nitrospinae bacterium]|nr:2-hydroxymuconate tautomerase family protein [Nitrospinota bacterium]